MKGFLRTTERPRDSESVRGVRVARWSRRLGVTGSPEPTLVPGQVWVFPGSDAANAMVLVNANLGDDVLKSPDVSIEFGVRDRDSWICEELVKAHNLT